MNGVIIMKKRLLRIMFIVGIIGLATVGIGHHFLLAQDLEFGPPYFFSGGFQNPFGIGIDASNGHLLVVDTGHHQVAWMSLADVLTSPTFTTFGHVSDSSLSEALVDPQGIAADSEGNVYVVDTRQNEVQLFQWDSAAGNYIYVPGFASATDHMVDLDGVPIESPRDVAAGPDGSVYLLDSGNNRVLVADGPADTTWEVFLSGADWGNPYGITVGHDGKLYIADTDNHRIMRHWSGVIDTFGSYGTGPGQFRYPRDVAVDIDGRMYVVDCFNHRMEIIDDSGNHVFSLGHAPTYSSVQKIAIDHERRLYIVDSDRNAVIAYLGEDVPVPFDLYIRDYLNDSGAQPSDPLYTLASPDILVRHAPDIDLTVAASAGLNSYAFQQPRYDQDNFIYFAIHNKGTQEAIDGFARVYWADQGSTLTFPDDFSSAGFHLDPAGADEGNTFMIPAVAAVNGVRIIGPFLWRPPAPETAVSMTGDFYLIVRIIHPFDTPVDGNGITGVRDNNNIALRSIKVIRGPFPTGEQNTLVVSVLYNDDGINEDIDSEEVQTRIGEMAGWMEEVSYGEVTVEPLYRGPIRLPENSTHYASPSNSLLIEMAQDALDILLVNEPELLDGVLPTPDDDIDRLILVTTDSGEVDWATTGHWPYLVDGEDRYLTVSVQAKDNRTELFSHGYCHQLGMVDLYPHENVTLPFPYADGWDNMAQPINGVHPLVWSKELSTWVTTHRAEIFFIPRPSRGDSFSATDIPLYVQAEAEPGQNVGITFGLTERITGFPEETHFFYVEARDNTEDNADRAAPGSGVLMYYVNEETPHGHGPVMIRDHGSSPGHDLTRAAIPVGETEAPEGTGIEITVNDGTPGGADYLIDVTYNPPVLDYDVYITRGDPPHISPDIWIQQQPYTYDENSIPSEEEREDNAVGDQENRIWALVHNHGPATAYNVDVWFHISEPYHTVGGEPDFEFYENEIIPEIPPGESRAVNVPWFPIVEDPHSCVWVELHNLFDDNNSANNNAQQNLYTDWSTSSSPYKKVTFPFQITNGEETPQLVYFRADGIPQGWKKRIIPPKVYLMPGNKCSASIEVTPPESAPLCTSYDTAITAWTPRGDTLVKLGGTSLIINLGEAVNVDFQTKVRPCKKDEYKHVAQECWVQQKERERSRDNERDKEGGYDVYACPCMVIEAQGCTNPPLKNDEIEIRYRDDEGNPAYHFVTTDEHGCFHDFMVVTDGGTWDVTVNAGGEDCIAPVSGTQKVYVPLPTDRGDDPDFDKPGMVTSFSRAVEGKLHLLDWWDKKCDNPFYGFCDVEKMRHKVKIILMLEDPCDKSIWHKQQGILESTELFSIFLDNEKGRGCHSGEAVIHLKDGTMIKGVMSGMTNANAHRKEGMSAGKPCQVFPYLDGRFVGKVVKGHHVIGTRVIFDYYLSLNGDKPFNESSVKGRIDGVIEEMCVLHLPQKLSALDRAIHEARCLVPVSKKGKGWMSLGREKIVVCPDGKKKTFSTEHHIQVSFEGNKNCDKDINSILNGSLSVRRLVHEFENQWMSRGYHGGEFELKSKSDVILQGKLQGFTHLNTHKSSNSACLDYGHMQGIMQGIVKNGLYKGCAFRALYVAQLGNTKETQSAEFDFFLEGAVLCDCRDKKSSIGITKDEYMAGYESNITKQVRVVPRNELTPEQKKKLESIRKTYIEKHYGKKERLSSEKRRYADLNRDGKVDDKEFLRFKIVEKAFQATDTNKDGVLQQQEVIQYHSPRMEEFYFKSYAPKGSRVFPLQEARKQFPLLVEADHDRSGTISRQELCDWLEKKYREDFKDRDTNGDNKIDLSEHVASMPPPLRIGK